jgi:hypothetical protein
VGIFATATAASAMMVNMDMTISNAIRSANALRNEATFSCNAKS